ncbi:MAG: LacI family DNA-binding transcriptional regulator [Armatimonadetes bacterium]|nr:LacI family DNA-binding transcriptional regulator [Armatimonadota bacterium]
MRRDRQHGRVTLADIAQHTGVSKVTVSYVLNDRETALVKISEGTRARVRAAATELGYHPNALARALTRCSTDTLTLVMQSPNVFRGGSGFMNELLHGVVEAVNRLSFDLMLHTKQVPDGDAETRALTDGRSDGCLLLRDRDDPLAASLAKATHPFVLLFARTCSAPGAWFVDTDNILGGRLAAKHLLTLGHRRILFIGGPDGSVAAQDRQLGFSAALTEAGVSPNAYGTVRMNYGGTGAGELAHLMNTVSPADRPTALFAWSDDVAVAAMETLRRECGFHVPGDVSVIGFDGTKAVGEQGCVPRLTSVRQPIDTIAGRAAELLIARVRGDTPTETQLIFAPELLVRDSCALRRD